MNGTCHNSVIQHAWKILKNDGHFTFSYIAQMYESNLCQGSSFADSAKQPLYIDIHLKGVIGFGCSLYTWRENICNMSTLEHYYNPGTGFGLDLSQYSSLEDWVEIAIAAGAILLGAAGFWVDAEADPPLNFSQPYRSAAEVCQEQYDLAVQAWRGLLPAEGDAYTRAMFHLGWACHFLADICVSPHTVSNEFWTHDNYENAIDTHLADETQHAQNISTNLSQYNLNSSAADLVRDAAAATQQELYLYQNDDWDTAIRLALPRAEIYTARLMAKFFQEVGIPQWPYPITTRVIDMNQDRIPHACMFVRMDNGPWLPLETDDRGTENIPLEAYEHVDFRPALPGYMFQGHCTADAPNLQEFIPIQSPLSYTYLPDATHTNPTITFKLSPSSLMPVVASIDVAALASVSVPASVGVRVVDRAVPLHSIPQQMERLHVALMEMVDLKLSGGIAGQPQPALQVGSPTPVHLKIHVYRPVIIHQAAFARSTDQVRDLLRLSGDPNAPEWVEARQRRRTISRDADRLHVRPDPAVIESISHMPTTTDLHGNSIHTGQVDRRYSGPLSGAPVILSLAPGQHQVKVEVVASPGMVGFCCQNQSSLTLTTNPFECAAIRVLPGNQPGLLRLKITVRDSDTTSDIGDIVKNVDLWVMPPGTGIDTEPFYPPILTAE